MTQADPQGTQGVWAVEFDDRARRELRRLDPKIQKDILRYLRERIAGSTDPRQFGKPLRMNGDIIRRHFPDFSNAMVAFAGIPGSSSCVGLSMSIRTR